MVIKAGFVHGHGIPVKWNKENLEKYILACRKQGGIPLFVPTYAGKEWEVNGQKAVQAKCLWGEGEEMPVYFYGVPEKDIETIEFSSRDWETLMKKYAPDKLPEAESYPIIIPRRKYSVPIVLK